MRLVIGGVLLIGGGIVVLYAIYAGITPLISLYAQTLRDPMADGATGADVSKEMLHAAAVGAIGAIPFVVGMSMVKGELYRRALRAVKGTGPKR